MVEEENLADIMAVEVDGGGKVARHGGSSQG